MGRRRATTNRWVLTAVLGVLIVYASGCEAPNALLRKRGMDALRADDLGRAEANFSKGATREPTDWKSHHYLGKVYLRQRRSLDARMALEKALSLRLDELETPEILDDLAEALVRLGERDRLAVILAESCRNYGTAYDFRRQGRYLAKIDDMDGAVLAFKKAARFSEGDAGPHLDMADLYESIGDSQRAIEALRQAYTIQPNSPRIATRLRGYGVVPGPTVVLSVD